MGKSPLQTEKVAGEFGCCLFNGITNGIEHENEGHKSRARSAGMGILRYLIGQNGLTKGEHNLNLLTTGKRSRRMLTETKYHTKAPPLS